jgi:elongation factor Ts
MEIPASLVKELRGQSGAGIMDCRNALLQTEGNVEKALELLKEQGYAKAQKKSARTASQGLVECYIHTGGRIGALIEINCETDFVARTDEFKSLAHDLAMQVTACSPQFISEKDIPEGEEVADPAIACLLQQPFIKSPDMTVQDIITQAIARIGENIRVSRFARFEIGE